MSAGASRDSSEDHPHQRGWLVSFADLVSILLTFMVMLFALSAHDRDPAGGIRYDPLLERLGAIQMDTGSPATARLAPAQETPPFDNELDYLAPVLAVTLRDHPGLADLHIERRHDRLELRLSGAPLFVAGSSELAPGASARLAVLGHALADLRPRIAVLATVNEAPGSPLASRPLPSRPIARAPLPPPSPAAEAAWELALERAIATRAQLRAAGLDRQVTVSARVTDGAAAQVAIVLFEGGQAW